jgi:oxygen-independent coproporphyrinogen-3 oxidase
MKGLYIHIPFCKHICSYCDFPKIVTFKEAKIKEYIDKLLIEFDNYKEYYKDVTTVFIGGGTPNAIPTYLLEKLLNKVMELTKHNNIIEYSIECNPELLNQEQVDLFKKYHITRVSLGAESFNDDILLKLGRHHKKSDIFRSVKLLKENGITNINIDLIFAHPFDSLDLVKENLENFYLLNIPHISYYSMILEDKTVFKYQIENKIISEFDEDLGASLYEYIMKDLKNHGYDQYEISNYAKSGFESKHNMLYWQDLEYIGVGLGASGYLLNVRYTNALNFKDYYDNKLEYKEILSKDETEKEFMMVGFRMMKGPSKIDFLNRFNVSIYDKFKESIDKLIEEDLIYETETNYCLTNKGILLANLVFMEFA